MAQLTPSMRRIGCGQKDEANRPVKTPHFEINQSSNQIHQYLEQIKQIETKIEYFQLCKWPNVWPNIYKSESNVINLNLKFRFVKLCTGKLKKSPIVRKYIYNCTPTQ